MRYDKRWRVHERTATVERSTSYHDLDVPFTGFRHRSGRNTTPRKDRLMAVCLQERNATCVNKSKKAKIWLWVE